MSLEKIENGDLPDADPVMANFGGVLKFTGLNTIRQLQDRSISLTANGSEWCESYIDVDGRLDSVNTSDTDATFDTDKYKTTASSTSYIYHIIPSGTFSSTISACFGTFLSEDWETGSSVEYKLLNNYTLGNLSVSSEQSWSDAATHVAATKFCPGATNSTVTCDIKGTASGGTQTVTATWYYIDGTSASNSATTTVNTYSSKTLTNPNSSKVLKKIIVTYGSDINGTSYYIKNIAGTLSSSGSDDSGWLNANEVSSFTAFSTEPYQCIVRLTPASSPTAGYPSINGFWVGE